MNQRAAQKRRQGKERPQRRHVGTGLGPLGVFALLPDAETRPGERSGPSWTSLPTPYYATVLCHQLLLLLLSLAVVIVTSQHRIICFESCQTCSKGSVTAQATQPLGRTKGGMLGSEIPILNASLCKTYALLFNWPRRQMQSIRYGQRANTLMQSQRVSVLHSHIIYCACGLMSMKFVLQIDCRYCQVLCEKNSYNIQGSM